MGGPCTRMPLPDWRPETRAAIAAARVGLDVVLRRERADEVQLKGLHDPGTGTDLLAQAEIQRVLAEHEPSIAFVGEEGGAKMSEADRCWMVDPVCGTSNFAVDLPFYAVNVALVEGGWVMAGVVGDGVTGQMY